MDGKNTHKLVRSAAGVAMAAMLMMVSACATRTPSAPGPRTTPTIGQPLRTQLGFASYYGREFHGRRTASGQRFDMRAPVAAHPSYPFGTRVRVTNLANQRNLVVTIVDRGPTRPNRVDGVVIDLSQGAAERLAFIREGRTRVRVDVLEWGSGQK